MLVLGLALSSCRAPLEERDQQQDARPLVLTTFTVLADMAANVAGERLQVKSITK